ncbi:putative signal recognition particle protein [Penicillium brasilianum]|uniref:Signal recognition particle subunit SRP72 n=1 Tax=Penicillium brasilianum TaxID=104259 RepID=A0A1S9RWR7_PENBI|nr:putative signal recognition particle protein [Penicillium brasilianum]
MVAQTLSSLLQRATIDDHEEVLKSCNETLKKSKNDQNAQHIKAIALLKLDRYEDALRVFETGSDALKQAAGLEYAYALYKCGKLDEALDAVTKSGAGRGASHLEAQVSYRAEKFHRAADLYEQLSQDGSSHHEANDLGINSWATDAQLVWKGEAEYVRHDRPSREDLESFETAYNAACLTIAKGAFAQGEVLLNRAKNICQTSEDLTSEDRAAELLPIAVQYLYVLLRLGKTEQAEALLEEISVEELTIIVTITSIPELSTKKIARNNIVLARQTNINPFILYKALHETPDSVNNDRLFDYQDNILVGNSHAADLLVQKYDGIIRSTNKALSKSSCPSTTASTNLLSVYNAAAQAEGQTGQKALKKILPLLERRPKDLGLLLTVVQLYVNEGNTTSAITTMERSLQALEESISEADQDARFNPGLLSALVSLYQLEGRKLQIRSTLAQAAAYWRKKPDSPASLLRAAATSLLHSDDQADLTTAGDLFKALYQQDSSDRVAIAGYVASQATLNYSQVESQLEQLPEVSELVADIDVSALESAGIMPSATSAAAAAAFAGARKRTAADKDARAAKRVRKSRLPKDYDPEKKADPERWLPLRDRSSYRPKGKKNKQRAADRTQGGPVNEKAEESPASAQQKAGGGGGGGSSKNKKKKGKR